MLHDPMTLRVAAFVLMTFALVIEPSSDDPGDNNAPPFISEIGSPLFVLIVTVIAAVFLVDVVRTWWQTNEWRRSQPRQRRH
jgi:hypothetical protein